MSFPEPENFSIRDSAKRKIAEIIGDHIPAICWIVTYDPLGEYETQGPGIAGYEAGQLPEDAIKTISGLRVALPLIDADRKRFENKTLNYEEDRGFFLTPPDV